MNSMMPMILTECRKIVTLYMLKIISIIIFLTCSINMWSMSVHSIPYDSVHYEIFRDTVYDTSLPHIEIETLTYSNFNQTTVGYQLILRNTELEILDVELYISNPQKKLSTIKPFSLRMGKHNAPNRIDRVSIWNKFPYDTICPDTDSLLIITDQGNITLYMSEERRLEQALDKERSVFNLRNEELQDTNHKLLIWLGTIVVVLIIFVIIALTFHYVGNKKREDSMANLVAILDENEAKSKNLNRTISSLFKSNFETLNKLCYEYYEKADTQTLRKSIFAQIEKEILRFRDSTEVSALEEKLNKYLDNIMIKVDTQLPNLPNSDRTLLVYLFSGFSARTICSIYNIEIKTFYMRRYRLKNKIQASDAPDKDIFIDQM